MILCENDWKLPEEGYGCRDSGKGCKMELPEAPSNICSDYNNAYFSQAPHDNETV